MEIDLLKAMYETSVAFNPSTSEVLFRPLEHAGAQVVLRLPDSYPRKGKPLVLSACDSRKHDLRGEVAEFIDNFGGDEGEVLDVLLQKFVELLESQQSKSGVKEGHSRETESAASSKTAIIWLHHLSATSKRKLAIRPTTSSDLISGITKPGYPGVMLFTGLQHAVDDHVAELKGLNWQAFQVRYEEDEKWNLVNEGSEKGIVEVETMAEVVRRIPEGRHEHFLKAVGVK